MGLQLPVLIAAVSAILLWKMHRESKAKNHASWTYRAQTLVRICVVACDCCHREHEAFAILKSLSLHCLYFLSCSKSCFFLQAKRILFFQLYPRRFWAWWCGGLHVLDLLLIAAWLTINMLWVYLTVLPKINNINSKSPNLLQKCLLRQICF